VKEKLSEILPRAVSSQQFADFNRLLGRVLERSMPLPEALSCVAEGLHSRRLKNAVRDVRAGILDGKPLDEAMESHPRVFPSTYRAVVKAGLASGSLPRVLGFVEMWHGTMAQVRRMTLPMLGYTTAVMAVLCVLLLVFRETSNHFWHMYGELGIELPLLTRMVSAVFRNAHALIAAVVVGPVFFYIVWRLAFLTEPTGRQIYRIPVIGKVLKLGGIARFCSMMGALLETGQSVSVSVGLYAASERNRYLRYILNETRKSLEEGDGLAEAGIGQLFFPRTLAMMILTGQKRGTLPETMRSAAQLYVLQLRKLAIPFAEALAGIALVLTAGTVGTIVVAFFLPFMSITRMM